MKKEIFKGGYPSPLLNGLKAVNCGSHFEIDGLYYEAMSYDISTHLNKIVSFYFYENSIKKEMSVWKNENNHFCFGIAFYKNKYETQSYRYYNLQIKNIEKYNIHKKHLMSAYHLIFDI